MKARYDDLDKDIINTPPIHTLTWWQTEIHQLAIEKGWWPHIVVGDKVEAAHKILDGSVAIPTSVIIEKLCLIHAEVSEALEFLRYEKMSLDKIQYMGGSKPEGFSIELADVVIRILDLCCALDINIEEAIRVKHEYNKTRPYRHGNKTA